MTFRLSTLAATALGFAVIAPAVTSIQAQAQTTPAPTPTAAAAPADPDLGFFGRFVKAYRDEENTPTGDPITGPPGNRAAPYPPQPQASPPFPFTVWPYGGTNPIGATLPSSVDSPLMTALKPTSFGQFLDDAHTQIYGWVNPGFNISTSNTKRGGNFPAAYAYDANILWLDQAVVIFERLPDTVQQDHVDWGFRVSPIYGETYRYTTGLGYGSRQLQKANQQYGFDIPMVYGELYIPGIAEGLMIRAGRYISVPDTEAQLAPNNYMYSHSMTYAYDNYTNTGILFSLQATKNLVLQAGVTVGTDTAGWDGGHLTWSTTAPVPRSNVDPGMQPSLTACIRYQTDTAYDAAYACGNGLNNGTFGYNNLQQFAFTYYHKFDEKWHITFEIWDMHENHTPNAAAYGEPNQQAVFTNLTALANGPFGAWCRVGQTFCQSNEYAMVSYLNYRIAPDDNISWRVEFFNDASGQRTGIKDRYANYAVGWQHWFTPTIMIRPEIAVYNALDRKSFNRNGASNIASGPGAANGGGASAMSELIASADLIWHF